MCHQEGRGVLAPRGDPAQGMNAGGGASVEGEVSR